VGRYLEASQAAPGQSRLRRGQRRFAGRKIRLSRKR